MYVRNKLLYGVGINDADYLVKIGVSNCLSEENLEEYSWVCPFYSRWRGMIQRCYSENWIKRSPAYLGCSVVAEWHHFMAFKAWMETQDWEGKQLDKDVLVRNNKEYGPDTCVFIDQKVNKFLTERNRARGECLIGVSLNVNQTWCASSCVSK